MDPLGWGDMTIFTKILFVILILAVLGFNVITYLGLTIDSILDIILPTINSVLNFLGFDSIGEVAADGVSAAGNITKSGITLAKDVTQGTIDVASGAAISGVDVLDKTVGAAAKKSSGGNPNIDDGSTDSGKNKVKEDKKSVIVDKEDDLDIVPDDSSSGIQKTGPGGYCNVGSFKGMRSCIEVDDSSKCMSGEIFPTRDICINPSLRE